MALIGQDEGMTVIGEVIATGTRSTVHAVGRDLVAKVPLAATPNVWISQEAKFTAAVRAAGAPAPNALDVIEIDGRSVSVYERIVGPSMWEYIADHPCEATVMGRRLAELHSDVLELAPPIVLPHQRDRLSCKIRAAAVAVDPTLIGALRLLPVPPARLNLCHGDVHPGNVILSKDGPVLIDWFDACRGMALGDIARTLLLVGAGGASSDPVPHLPGAAPETLTAFHRSYLDAVRESWSPSSADLGDWLRIEAAARLGEGVAATDLLAIWHQVG